MKFDEAVESLTKFFNDLIGSLVPGAVLFVGLALMHIGPTKLQEISQFGDAESGVILLIAALLFALGHTLLAVHENGVKYLLQVLCVVPQFDTGKASQRESYKWFSKLVEDLQASVTTTSAWSFNDLRNIALSVSTEAALLGRRFMFISLLCNGLGTALLIICLDFLVCNFSAPYFLYTYDYAAHWSIQLILFVGAIWALFRQGNAFYVRAMTIPFSIAVTELKFKKETSDGSAAN